MALVAGVLVGRRSRASVQPSRALSDRTSFQETELEEEAGLILLHRDNPDLLSTQFCPICNTEYVAGTDHCEDCGVELVEEPDQQPHDPPVQQDLVRVFRIRDSLKGHLIHEFLSSNGVRNTYVRSALWDVFGADIYVLESDVLRAKKIIHQFLEETEETPA
ncbi:MAG: DUF2007 domain-containing protein [Candidatus Sumerlaeaceae bacterium]|nr:DUF2007 domain-containing protein [Candidatus Sumerlaeaceae bacterium]